MAPVQHGVAYQVGRAACCGAAPCARLTTLPPLQCATLGVSAQALVDDVLRHRLNRVSVPAGDGEKPRTFHLDTETDAFWRENAGASRLRGRQPTSRRSHASFPCTGPAAAFPEAVESNGRELAETTELEKTLMAGASGGDGDEGVSPLPPPITVWPRAVTLAGVWYNSLSPCLSADQQTQQLQRAVDQVQPLLARKKQLETHTSLLQACMDSLSRRFVPQRRGNAPHARSRLPARTDAVDPQTHSAFLRGGGRHHCGLAGGRHGAGQGGGGASWGGQRGGQGAGVPRVGARLFARRRGRREGRGRPAHVAGARGRRRGCSVRRCARRGRCVAWRAPHPFCRYPLTLSNSPLPSSGRRVAQTRLWRRWRGSGSTGKLPASPHPTAHPPRAWPPRARAVAD